MPEGTIKPEQHEQNFHKLKAISHKRSTYHWFKDDNHVSHLKGENELGFAYSLGYVHARERGLQLTLFQTLIRGNLSSWFDANDETREVDEFMLKMGFYYQGRKEEARLEGKDYDFLLSYIEGLNHGRRDHYPIELKLLRVPREKWTMADSMALLKLMAYLGLAQSQQDFEKFFAVSLSKAIHPRYFKSLLHPHLEEDFSEIIELLKKVQFDNTPIPDNCYFKSLPSLKNSNNWVVTGSKSESGFPLMACDPHLEVNRLPALWFECTWSQPSQKIMGITLPGVPGFIMGRNNDLAFSFTYGFMDTIDYFIEEIKDGQVKEEKGWSGLIYRKEKKSDKSGKELCLHLFETDRGALEIPKEALDDSGKIKDGFYLSRAWTGHKDGGPEALKVVRQLANETSAKRACELVKDIFISTNWLFCDRENNITFQQAGFLPERSHSGLLPLPGWKTDNHWKTHHHKEALQHAINPEEGFLATANNDVQSFEPEKPLSINLPVAPYRQNRIQDFLKNKESFGVAQFKSLQSDLYSYQAKYYFDLIRPMIPNTPCGRVLKSWDFTYQSHSEGAFLFEKYLDTLYQDLFGSVFGPMAWEKLQKDSVILADYYGLFDRILLEPKEHDRIWFENALEKASSGEGPFPIEKLRDQCLEKALKKTLSKYPLGKLKKWSQVNSFVFSHILFGEKLANWKLFNKGPYPMQGSRATVSQGNLYSDRGRKTSYAPSFRMVTDLAEGHIFSIIPGGPSDRFYSKSYTTDINKWLNFQYKTVLPH